MKTTEDGKDESDPCRTNCSPTFTILDPLGSANDLVRKDERKNPSIACTTTIRHSFGFKYYFCDAAKTLFLLGRLAKSHFFFCFQPKKVEIVTIRGGHYKGGLR